MFGSRILMCVRERDSICGLITTGSIAGSGLTHPASSDDHKPPRQKQHGVVAGAQPKFTS